MTRWHPDTCACVFDVEDWETNTATIYRACAIHAAHPTPFLAVYRQENQRKNLVLARIADVVPARATDPPLWEFTAQRQLQITLPGWAANERSQVIPVLARDFPDVVVRP